MYKYSYKLILREFKINTFHTWMTLRIDVLTPRIFLFQFLQISKRSSKLKFLHATLRNCLKIPRLSELDSI